MRPSPRHRLLTLSLLGLVVLPACEEMQDPEPLTKTVPVALLLLAVPLALAAVLVRTVFRKARAHAVAEGPASALRYPRITATLVVAPLLVLGAVMAVAAGWNVGFDYRRPHMSMWSWDEAVELWAMLLASAVVALGISCAAALAVLSRHRRERNAGIVLLVLAVAGLSFAGGVGLVWLPGLLGSFVQSPDDRRKSTQTWVRSSSVAGAASTSSPSASSNATRFCKVHSVSANASRA